MKNRKLRPVLDGSWWMIGPSPNLNGKIQADDTHRLEFEEGRLPEHNAPVDHHIFRDWAGKYHLWGCVRATAVGRILYHWQTEDVTSSPWEDTGDFIRVDQSAGESMGDWFDEEWIQSPYFIEDGGTYYMFYGGHRAGLDVDGKRVPDHPEGPDLDMSLHQICLMTSAEGRDWVRHKNPDGSSRLFLGPGETRDPCLIRIGGLWHMYYAGYYDWDHPDNGAGFVVRTSEDLISWSDWTLVHRDPQFGAGRTETECPFVIEKEGYFYLFRTVDYYKCETYVFRSENPFDFGIGDAAKMLVARLPCAAPELYTFDGIDYISSSHTPLFGEQMCKLKWIDD